MVEKAYRQLTKEREVRETLSRLSASGARTHYVQLDVTDEQAFGALIDDVYATYGRLDGVIHGAGIIEDKLVRQKSPESFDRVLRTKAISSFVLSRHLRPDSLRFLIFFSSVAGRFGNRGQADYAAANEVVSKLAVMLQRRWPVRVCSIAWAPWDKLGMVSPELKREFARRGVELLSPAAGRQALWREIQQDPGAGAEIVVGGHAAGPLTVPDEPEPLPLLKHATREASSVDAVRFVRSIDPAVDSFLNDHRLDGKPVLPLAFATELMAEAAQAAWPDLRVVALRDLQLLKGIVVDGAPVPVTVTVRSAVHSTDNGLTEVDVDISTPALKPPMRYRAVVQLAARDREPSAFDAPAWPLVPLAKPVSEAYRDWTFHGPMFQRITGIAGIGVDALLGTIYSPSSGPAIAGVRRPAWIIDPFVFDAALQLLLMWSRARNDKTALPSRFRSFSRFGSLSDQPLTAYVAVESLAAGHALRSTVHFVDSSGRALALLEAMEASCTNALNRLAAVDGGEGGRR
jgi:NAD(P)-dependent dehydrogenase (short-subunit alcohol dehydrogenase family)